MKPLARRSIVLALIAIVIAAAIPSRASAQEAPPPKRAVHIHGTATALDSGYEKHDAEDGSLQISHPVDGLIDAKIVGGHWEAWMATEAPFKVVRLELGGRSAFLVNGSFEPPFDQSCDVFGQWIEDLLLHVVDETTGDDLSGLEMVKREWVEWEEGLSSHPGIVRPGDLVVTGLRSPVRITKFGSWFIRSPGHAWNHCYRTDRSDETGLELSEACRLVIDAKGLDPKLPTKLRIDLVDGFWPVLTLDSRSDGHVVLDSLPARRMRVRALLDFHRKPWNGHTVTLGETRVTLAPDAPAHAEFTVGPPPPGLHEDGTIDRRGFVTLPDGATRKRFTGDGSLEVTYGKSFSERRGPWTTTWSEGDYGYDRSTVAIKAGTFELRPPYGTQVCVWRAMLDGTTIELGKTQPLDAFDTIPDLIEIALPGPAAEKAEATPTVLHVLAADTKAELSHVEIVSGFVFPQSDDEHPMKVTPDQIVLREGASPLPLPASGRPRHAMFGIRDGLYWIRADGYGWVGLQQDPNASGERTVQLERASDLEVHLEPNVFDPKAVVRAREASDGGKLLFEAAPESSGATLLQGLPRGRYEVSLELGEWNRHSIRFGAVQVDGSHGGRITVKLAVEPPPPTPEPVPLSGTLFVPEPWGFIGAKLRIRLASHPTSKYADWIDIPVDSIFPFDPMQYDASLPGRLVWSAGKVPPGRYTLELQAFGFSREIEVGRDGESTAQIEIAPPADVVVHVLDAVTNLSVAIPQLLWRRVDASLDASATEGSPDDPRSTLRFRSPMGPLTIQVWMQPYALREENVEVRAGENQFTLRLERK